MVLPQDGAGGRKMCGTSGRFFLRSPLRLS